MSNIITADYNGTQVFFQDDAYLNATAIAKHFNKLPNEWLRLESTQQYIDLLSKKLNTEKSRILKTTRGINGGTWLHRRLAVPFARWLNVEFAIWCDEQIEKILIGQNQVPALPNNTNTTVDDRTGLRDAINMLVSKKGLIYSDAYQLVHHRFNVKSIEELSKEQLPQAVEYIHKIVLEGDLIEPSTLQLSKNSQNTEATLEIMVELYGYCLHAYEMQEKLSQYPDLADRIDSKIGGQYLHNLKHPLENAMTKAKRFIRSNSEKLTLMKAVDNLLN